MSLAVLQRWCRRSLFTTENNMPRPKRKTEDGSLLDEVKKANVAAQEVDINDLPLKTLGDYSRYNSRARAANKRLKVLRHPIKQCPEELHPKQRIVLTRVDGSQNPLPVYVSNALIHYDHKMVPGTPYDVPLCIVDYLSQKATPIWKRVTLKDGSQDTVKSGEHPRFAIRTLYSEAS